MEGAQWEQVAEPYSTPGAASSWQQLFAFWRFFGLHGTCDSGESRRTATKLSAWPPCVALRPPVLSVLHPLTLSGGSSSQPCSGSSSPQSVCVFTAPSNLWLWALFRVQWKPVERYQCQQAAPASGCCSPLPLFPSSLLLTPPSPTLRFPPTSSESPLLFLPPPLPHPTKS